MHLINIIDVVLQPEKHSIESKVWTKYIEIQYLSAISRRAQGTV